MSWDLRGRQPGILATAVVLATLSTSTTALRLWCRRWTGVGFWWDDYVLIIGQIMSYALAADLIVGVRFGLSLHRHELTPAMFDYDVSHFLKSLYSVEPFYALCMPAVKISILLFYWRLFRSVRWMRIGIIITAVMVIMWMIGAEIAAIFQCLPIHKFWNPEVDGYCINGLTYFKSITSTNLVTDAIVLCLPMPLVFKLNASLTRRISLAAGFLIGGFVSLISIIRIEYLNNPHDPDTLYATTNGPIWTAAETSLAVVCANLPILYTLIKQVVSRAYGTVRGTRRASSSTCPRGLSRPWCSASFGGGNGRNTAPMSEKAEQHGHCVSQHSVDERSNSAQSDSSILYPDKIYVRTEYDTKDEKRSPSPNEQYRQSDDLA